MEAMISSQSHVMLRHILSTTLFHLSSLRTLPLNSFLGQLNEVYAPPEKANESL